MAETQFTGTVCATVGVVVLTTVVVPEYEAKVAPDALTVLASRENAVPSVADG